MENKVVYIFGASGGIGFEIAKEVAKVGGKLILFSRNKDKIRKKAKMEGISPELILSCNVTDKTDVYQKMKIALKTTHSVDIVFYCVGTGQSEYIVNHSDLIWSSTLDTNLNGAYYVIKSVIPRMIKNKFGRIVLISSRFAKMGMPGLSAYSASKHALSGLIKCVALEVAQYNITINAICPSRVDTQLTDITAKRLSKKMHKPKTYILNKFNQENAIKRLIFPKEIADLALFLAGKDNQAITGESFSISGGMIYQDA